MVGIVIVSHSHKLAEGVRELAREMAGPDVRIAVAGGLALPDLPLGTDANLIRQAIDDAYSDDGVVVLMDLGSAILSAELALDDLPVARRARVILCAAPLVEGAIVAAVQARLGNPLDVVAGEARNALAAKAAQLGTNEANALSDSALVQGDEDSAFGRGDQGSALEGRSTDARAKAPNLGRGPGLQPRVPAPDFQARAARPPASAEVTGTSPDLSATTTTPPYLARLVAHSRHGLHARPAARFVQTASRFRANVYVRNVTTNSTLVSARSINGLALLGARQGHEIEISATGSEADAVLAALRSLADRNFGDVDSDSDVSSPGQPDPGSISADQAANVVGAVHEPPPPANNLNPNAAALDSVAPTDGGVEMRATFPSPSLFQGVAASPGIAIGPARRQRLAAIVPPQQQSDDPNREWSALLAAIEQARGAIRSVRDATAARTTAEAADIFEAHLLFLDDDALREPTRRAIFDERLTAAAAWQGAVDELRTRYGALEDAYLRARVADVREVGQQVLAALVGAEHSDATASLPGILVAANLTAAEAARLDPALVQGICLAGGAATAHAIILARSLGIPAVVGLGAGVLSVADGQTLVVDGDAGRVWLEPAPTTLGELRERIAPSDADRARDVATATAPALTRDGRCVEVLANVATLADVKAAVALGADGVGLYRTEVLFFGRPSPPDEDEQFAVYRATAQALAGRPLVIRTLDVGGDKPLPYLGIGAEANPFLGQRGIRVSLSHPELFLTQLRAIVRAAAEHPIKIMFPMIATLAEWRQARALLDQAREEVRQRGQSVPAEIAVGMMVEVPSAALCADQFAAEVDFFSIGTNDLVQYTLAAERGNASVASLADPRHPAVPRLIQGVVAAAHARGKKVAVCGEMAADAESVPLLVGLGVDELSVIPVAIPRIKEVISMTGA